MKNVITKAMQEQLLKEYEELLLANNSAVAVTPEQILTDEEVLKVFKISIRTLYRYRKEGKSITLSSGAVPITSVLFYS